MEYNLYEALNNAYGCTTQNYNKFEELINSVKWDDVFQADGETYYIKGNLTLTVENINPFAEEWKPSVFIGSFYKELGIA